MAAQTLSKQLNYHNLTDIKREQSQRKNSKTLPKRTQRIIENSSLINNRFKFRNDDLITSALIFLKSSQLVSRLVDG
ncbi:hypothetical protein QUA81_31655, partial [Microcoleus sp. F6_B4]